MISSTLLFQECASVLIISIPSPSRNEQSQLLAILNNYFFIIIPKEIKLKNSCKIFLNILPKKKIKDCIII